MIKKILLPAVLYLGLSTTGTLFTGYTLSLTNFSRASSGAHAALDTSGGLIAESGAAMEVGTGVPEPAAARRGRDTGDDVDSVRQKPGQKLRAGGAGRRRAKEGRSQKKAAVRGLGRVPVGGA